MRLRSPARFALTLSLVLACGGEAPSEATPAAAASTKRTEASAPAKEKLPDAAELLSASVAALGGAERMAAMSSYYSESQMSAGKLGLSGTAKTWWQGGDFYIETDMPGVGLMRIGGQGGVIWGDDPISGLRTIAGVEAEQAMWSASLCLANDWRKYFDKAETTAVVEREGRRLAEVTMTSKLGDKVVLRIDLESKEPVSQSFAQANPLGEMPVTVTFKDFREVDGVRLPFVQEVDASLTKLVSTTTKFEPGATVDPSRFALPKIGGEPFVGSPRPVAEGALVEAGTKHEVKPAAAAE